jgi:hypothetical protein
MAGGHLVALGGGGGIGAVRPGPSLEEEALGVGYRIGRLRGWVVLGRADAPAPEVKRVRAATESWPDEFCGLGALVDMEARRSSIWLAADLSLGKTLLLGPGPVGLHSGTPSNRRASGFLADDGGLTMAGWWRLAFQARQGIGPIECDRQKRLRWPRIRRHTRLVQRLCMEMMETEKCVPLGVELSATGIKIGRLFEGVRSDALLRGEDGELIWVEVMRREIKREHRYVTFSPAERKYELLETTVLPRLADVLERPVRYVLQLPGRTIRKTFRPRAGSGW